MGRRLDAGAVPFSIQIDDPGDHVHPNDAGNRAMAAAIDASIFRR
jgi:lysophospholipase L1-like esterase